MFTILLPIVEDYRELWPPPDLRASDEESSAAPLPGELQRARARSSNLVQVDPSDLGEVERASEECAALPPAPQESSAAAQAASAAAEAAGVTAAAVAEAAEAASPRAEAGDESDGALPSPRAHTGGAEGQERSPTSAAVEAASAAAEEASAAAEEAQSQSAPADEDQGPRAAEEGGA